MEKCATPARGAYLVRLEGAAAVHVFLKGVSVALGNIGMVVGKRPVLVYCARSVPEVGSIGHRYIACPLVHEESTLLSQYLSLNISDSSILGKS